MFLKTQLSTLAERLDYPFETPPSPYADKVEQWTRQWVKSFNLLPNQAAFDRFCQINYGWMGARFFPYAPFEQTALGSDWIAWLFTLDDEFDELTVGAKPYVLSQAFEKFLAILRGQEAPTQTPLSLALGDLRQRTLHFAPSLEWMERFIESIEKYFNACRWEAQNRQQNQSPDLETYLRLRQDAGAQPIAVALVELMEGQALTPSIQANSEFQALVEITLNLMGWSNDILSIEKELLAGDLHNIVLVLMAESNLSETAAFDLAIEIHNQEMQKFLDIELQLPSFSPEEDAIVQGYLRNLRSLIRGTLDWTTLDAPVRYTTEHLLPPKNSAVMRSLVTYEAA
jgi:5-epi-alpha-selinene synthase